MLLYAARDTRGMRQLKRATQSPRRTRSGCARSRLLACPSPHLCTNVGTHALLMQAHAQQLGAEVASGQSRIQRYLDQRRNGVPASAFSASRFISLASASPVLPGVRGGSPLERGYAQLDLTGS